MNKSIFLSKTFWLQVAALASAMFPPVQAWLVENPVEFVGALAALNVLVRFLTRGSVSILTNGAGKVGLFVAWLLIGTAVVGTLPSCSNSGEGWPVTGSLYLRDPNSGAKAGLVFAPGQPVAGSLRVPVYDPDTNELIGLAELATTGPARVIAEK